MFHYQQTFHTFQGDLINDIESNASYHPVKIETSIYHIPLISSSQPSMIVEMILGMVEERIGIACQQVFDKVFGDELESLELVQIGRQCVPKDHSKSWIIERIQSKISSLTIIEQINTKIYLSIDEDEIVIKTKDLTDLRIKMEILYDRQRSKCRIPNKIVETFKSDFIESFGNWSQDDFLTTFNKRSESETSVFTDGTCRMIFQPCDDLFLLRVKFKIKSASKMKILRYYNESTEAIDDFYQRISLLSMGITGWCLFRVFRAVRNYLGSKRLASQNIGIRNSYFSTTIYYYLIFLTMSLFITATLVFSNGLNITSQSESGFLSLVFSSMMFGTIYLF